MAAETTTRKIRVEEQLEIKIGDAKNLLGGNNGANGSTSKRDVYCTIALDQEEIYRTPTMERTFSPFFDELFEFEIPRKFRYLSLYVWARDRHLKQDKPVGKIAIRREELHLYNHKDHWFPLRPVDADSEVQGMANIKVSIDNGAGILKTKFDFDDHIICPEMKENNGNRSPSSVVMRSESCRQAMTMSSPGIVLAGNNYTNSNGSGTITKTKSLFGHADLNLFNTQSRKSHLLLNSSVLHNAKSRVSICVAECMDLAKKNGNCDPYVICTATYTNNRVIKKRTKCRKKTTNPHFDEVMQFDLTVDNDAKNDNNNAYTIVPVGGADLNEICVSVWHSGGMAEDIFLGEIKIPLRGKQQQNAVQASAWYFLQSRSSQSRPAQSCATPPGTRLSVDNSLGSLRLKLNYIVDQVFPLATYDALLNLLVQSVDQKPITTTAVYILGELISNKTEVAQPLVRLFTHQNLIAPIIKSLADHEISKLTDPTTIFRGNTLVSKMMDEAMKLSGLHYLHATLRPIVDDIVAEKKPCEIDPARAKDASVIEQNLKNLKVYVEKVFDAITSSAVHCPAVLCQIFHDLKECAAKHFPDNKEIRYSVVSGFIFLRFFAPAILGPKLFDLTTDPLDNQTNRTLTLISKTIQYLGNLVSSRSAQQPCKEEYTGQLYKIFCTEQHLEAVKHFLEVISTVGSNANGPSELEPVLLKEGMMAKRAQGRKRFFRSSFKQRYFRLTTQSLSYSKSKGQKPTCDIPLSDILAVERVHDRSFKLQNIFQIVRKDNSRPLYVQTANCVEEKEWVDLLRKICQTNEDRRSVFHPCAYTGGMWNCCNQTSQDAEGCKMVSTKPFQMELCTALDPARDLQRLHSLIMRHQKDIEQLMSVSLGPNPHSQYMPLSKSILLVNEIPQCRETLERIREVALNLDQVHRMHKNKLVKEMKLGSKQAPIGEDNYLHMTRSNLIMQNGVQYLTVREAPIYPKVNQQQSFNNNGSFGNEYTAMNGTFQSSKSSLSTSSNDLNVLRQSPNVFYGNSK